MVRGIKIDGFKSLTKNKDVIKYNKPEYVYIPLIVGNDTNIVVTIKKGDYVFKGQAVGHKQGDTFNIHSSVSGTVEDILEMMCLKGYNVKCIKIKNDFKEALKKNHKGKEKLNDYTKDEFVELLKTNGIRGLGGSDFTTYVKYQNDIDILVINAVECEPYITSDYTMVKLHCEEILEAIDAILDINKISKCYIGIKKNNRQIIDIVNDHIGTYPNIKLVELENMYPMGWERNLIKETTGLSYENYTKEIKTVVSNVSTIYAIYNALKYNLPITERIVTFSGTMLKNPQNVLLKIGTSVKEVMDKNFDIASKKPIYIVGGPMMGNSIDITNLVTTPNLNCVLVLPDKDFGVTTECLRCGKCVNHCPAKLAPVLIKDNVNNIDALKTLDVNKCVECGICSYICPAKLNVREYVRQAKANLRGDKNGK